MSAIKRDLTRIRHNTKIVATLGPGSNNVDLLRDMISIGGVHVVRFNFSHGTPEFHEENAKIVREAARQAGLEVAIMADLQGPKIRVSKIAGGSIQVEAGEKLLFDAALEGEGTRERGVFQAGEQYVITSGRRMRETGSTNSLEVRTVRE